MIEVIKEYDISVVVTAKRLKNLFLLRTSREDSGVPTSSFDEAMSGKDSEEAV